jgi:hypothetical protein
MPLPPLLFITNKNNEEPTEDIFLSEYLQNFFTVSFEDITDAPRLLGNFERCFIRNAWPSRYFEKEYHAMRIIVEKTKTRVYNPFHRNFYIEDKHYLIETGKTLPVIPTIVDLGDLAYLGNPGHYIIKPLDGCSSWNVKKLTRDELLQENTSGYIIQPAINFKDEISLYFIDNRFIYATITAGPNKRWELAEYEPSEKEIAWGEKFVNWNDLPYGLQRIDGCRLPTGEVLLMEIEDTLPYLSLDVLKPETKKRVLNTLVTSLQTNLIQAPSAALSPR